MILLLHYFNKFIFDHYIANGFIFERTILLATYKIDLYHNIYYFVTLSLVALPPPSLPVVSSPLVSSSTTITSRYLLISPTVSSFPPPLVFLLELSAIRQLDRYTILTVVSLPWCRKTCAVEVFSSLNQDVLTQ